jgi:hypothetical protein
MKDSSIIVKKDVGEDYWVCLRRMLHNNVRLSLVQGDPDDINCYHEQNFCFHDADLAQASYEAWDGEGDPPKGWVRHIETGRRYDPKTGKFWVAP